MRYSVQPATSSDVTFLAMAIDPDSAEWGQGEQADQTSRLLNTCAASSQVWAVHDSKGVPQALWGVSPSNDDPDVGCMWLLACESLETSPNELCALSSMVLDEMFAQYARLENYVDADKTRAIEMLRSVGFNIEAALYQASADTAYRRVWMERSPMFAATSQLVN